MPKKKEEQNMDTLVFLRRGNKIPTEEDTETKCGTETEGKTIQRLPHLRIHPIYSYKTQTLLWMPTSACWSETNIAVTWEVLLVHDKYRGGHSQPVIELNPGYPMEELEKGSKELKELSATHRRNNNMNHPVPPELPGTKLPTKEYTWRDPWLQLHM